MNDSERPTLERLPAGLAPGVQVGLTSVGATALAGSVGAEHRNYFSTHHIQAAAYFTRQAKAIETERAGSTEFSPEHRSYAMAAVFFAVSFLEAGVNELFADASDGQKERLAGLPEDTIILMAEMWHQGIPRTARYPVLEKYAIALSLARRPALNRGQAPWQPAQALVQLRNALVHYEPESIEADSTKQPDEAHPLERTLKGLFAPNPLTSAGNPFYPDKVLGHGCAAWAVRSATGFADAFAKLLGSVAPHDHVRTNLGTD